MRNNREHRTLFPSTFNTLGVFNFRDTTSFPFARIYMPAFHSDDKVTRVHRNILVQRQFFNKEPPTKNTQSNVTTLTTTRIHFPTRRVPSIHRYHANQNSSSFAAAFLRTLISNIPSFHSNSVLIYREWIIIFSYRNKGECEPNINPHVKSHSNYLSDNYLGSFYSGCNGFGYSQRQNIFFIIRN